MLEHGGRLLQAVRRYGIPRESWLDLSTGINPNTWQGAPLAIASWNRLPEEEDGLLEAAAAYYGAPSVLPVCGSQAAIQMLPKLRAHSRVGVPVLGYNEHAHRWKQAGHEVTPLAISDFGAALERLDVLVVPNPNNPTGERVTPAQLLEWHTALSERGGWLVIDEAFADCTPGDSLARYTADRAGLIVLRSLGKFFGLAGARVGFVLAARPLLSTLADALGPWTIAGPSRAVARGALLDRAWQEATRQRLRADSQRLANLLTRSGLPPQGGCELFQWVPTDRALEIHEGLASRGVLTRHFGWPMGPATEGLARESPAGTGSVPSLRFGLPADWNRLEEVLA